MAKARRVFPTLLDIQLPFPLEDCVSFFLAAAPGGQGIRALAVAARLSTARDRLQSLAAAGVDPHVLDQEGLALWTESLREIPAPPPPSPPEARAVLYLSSGSATLVAGRGEEFVAAHSVGPDDAAQVHRILRSHFPERPPVLRWLWAGPGAAASDRVSALHARLSADWPGPSATHDVRALTSGPLRCNFRVGPLAHASAAARAAAASARAAVLFLVSGLLLAAFSLAWGAGLRHREADIDRTFSSLRDRLAGYSAGPAKGEYALRIVRQKLDARRTACLPFLRPFDPSLAALLADAVRMAAAGDLRFESLSLDEGRAEVTGTAGDWTRCDQLARLLSARGFRVRADRKPPLDTGRIPFAILPEGPNG
jgi:hypothetical protein